MSHSTVTRGPQETDEPARRSTTSATRGLRLSVMLGLAALIPVVPGAQGAPTTTTPVPNTTSVLAAHHACSFRVIDKVLPTSRKTERVFRDGRHLISGRAKEKLINAESRASIVVDTSGRVGSRTAGDGSTGYWFAGRNVLYFYPGDEGPHGTVGTNGALYLLVGRAGETLAENGVVTAFVSHGRVTELCSKIS